MILTYDKNKIYNPESYENKLRRNMKQEIRMNYVRRPVQIPALNMLLKIPGMNKIYKLLMFSGMKIMGLLASKDKKEFLELKSNEILNSIPQNRVKRLIRK